MSVWTIEPRDPLVVRDGRPNQGRSESAARAFPLPSTLAGAVRTRLGLGADGVFARTSADELAALRAVAVRGPWLVEPDAGTFYAPTPADLVLLGEPERRDLRTIDALSPAPRATSALMDEGLPDDLSPVSARRHESGRKALDPPAFLRWDAFARWLARPGERAGEEADRFLQGAIGSLPREGRLHVQVGEHATAEDGMLFEVEGLRFVHPETRAPLALAVEVDDAAAAKVGSLREGLAPLGGKRRLVRWSRAGQPLPKVPELVLQGASRGDARSRVRVLLLTPALFEEGWRPGLSPGAPLGPGEGVTHVRLVAACLERPIAISGWDLAKQQPKRIRRAVPAGSVYWLELSGPPAARLAWVERAWARATSDAEEDRRDGFGVAAIGNVAEEGGAA
ncbi:type III-B CRISPR module-associated Cmr3 family protein [Sorangium sp. So ce131]|uniref:type III-B CRISPR module-associated Cmr3 family protein n=1 Tax=Sorangium sp. So ce131 TaxID=3133282 RepID=UPI003F5FA427